MSDSTHALAPGQDQIVPAAIPQERPERPADWPGIDPHLGSADDALMAVMWLWRDAVDYGWEHLWLSLLPTELMILFVVQLLRLKSGQEKAHVPAPWRKTLADLLVLDWKHVKEPFESLMGRQILKGQDVDGAAELWFSNRQQWKDAVNKRGEKAAVKTRGGLQGRKAAIAALTKCLQGNKGLQALLRLGPMPLRTDTPETRVLRRPRTPETRVSDETTPETGVIRELFPEDRSVNPTPPEAATPENRVSLDLKYSNTDPDQKASKILWGIRILKAEQASPEELREAWALIRSLSAEEKRDFCNKIPLTEAQKRILSRIEVYIGRNHSYVGKWTNCIKLDEECVSNALSEREATAKPPGDASIEGNNLNARLKVLSGVVTCWYSE